MNGGAASALDQKLPFRKAEGADPRSHTDATASVLPARTGYFKIVTPDTLWNSLYLDAAVKHLRAQGFPVTDEMCAHFSPIQYEHINFLGRYASSHAEVAGGLRPFHDGGHEPS